jgi:two-component system sensor histidine kinase/response regulator
MSLAATGGSLADPRALIQEERRRFASTLAHELRTPLVGILGFSELLIDDAAAGTPVPATAVAEQAELIRQSGERLLQLTQRCELWLDLTARPPVADSERQTWQDEQWPDSIHREVRRLAAAAGRTQEVSVDCEPATLAVPEGLLGPVIRQLVDNALKFSSPGSPIEIVGAATDESGYDLTITDGGRGFPLDQVGRIEAFVQFDRERHEQQGLGLGLAIVRGFADLVGGSLRLTRGPDGRGTRAQLHLPRVRHAGNQPHHDATSAVA